MRIRKYYSSAILIISFLMGTMSATLTSVDTLWAMKMRIKSRIHTMNWSTHEPHQMGTSLEAEILAEGEVTYNPEGSASALVTGSVCVTNTGTPPTENLAIKVFVQNKNEKERFSDFFNFDIDTEVKPIINSMEYFCYPFVIEFLPSIDWQKPLRLAANVTITNHSGWLPGDNNCPGPDDCPFGPTPAIDLILRGNCDPGSLPAEPTPTPTIEASSTLMDDQIPDTGGVATTPTVEAPLFTETPTATPPIEVPVETVATEDVTLPTETIAPTEIPIVEEIIEPTIEPTPETILPPTELLPE